MKTLHNYIAEAIDLKKIVFDEIRKLLKKYKIQELPYYMASKVGNGVIHVVEPNGRIEYTTATHIEDFQDYANALEVELKNSWICEFTYRDNPQLHKVIFAPCTQVQSGIMVARFEDGDTWMTIEYDTKKNLVYAYCNFMILSKDHYAEETHVKTLKKLK